jgi:hypothetical protein
MPLTGDELQALAHSGLDDRAQAVRLRPVRTDLVQDGGLAAAADSDRRPLRADHDARTVTSTTAPAPGPSREG